MTDKEKIKKDIESYKESMKGLEPHSDFRRGQITAYNQILQFIGSLPEESGCEVNFTTKNEDLEEEIQRAYYDKSLYDADNIDRTDFNCIARHFAEWQKQKDQETIELAEDHAMLAGMMKEREKMMKDTVEGTVKYEIGSAEIPQCDRRYQVLSGPTPIANAKLGDKVKIIILKTEQQ